MSKRLSSMFLCALAALLSLVVLTNTAPAQTARKRQTSRTSKTKKRAATTATTKAAPPTSAAPTATSTAAPAATEPATPAADPFALVPRRVEPATPATPAKDTPQVYQLRGLVHAVHRQPPIVAIAHEDIPGYMEAMTMNFSLKDNSWLEKLKPGDRIEAKLFVSQTEGKWWLENIVIKK